MKKDYLAPDTTVVLLDITSQILAASGEVSISLSEDNITQDSDLGGTEDFHRGKEISFWDYDEE